MVKNRSLLVAISALSAPVLAMQAMDDSALSNVTGQDGISIDLETNNLSIDEVSWVMDRDKYVDGSGVISNDNTGTSLESSLRLQNISIRGVDETGTVFGPAHITADIDVGSNGTEAGVSLATQIDRLRIQIDDVRLADSDTRSFGSLVLDAEAAIDMVNFDGLFNSTGSDAYLHGKLTNGNIFYRQAENGDPYLRLGNLNAEWTTENATIGITNEGLLTEADFIDVKLGFDLFYNMPEVGEQAFISNAPNERPILHFAWEGALKDPRLVWMSGGSWYGENAGASDLANKSEGLHFSSRWNFVNRADVIGGMDANREFRWRFGEADDADRENELMRFELSDWNVMAGAPSEDGQRWGHHFPLIGFDALANGQGPGGLCWGGPQDGSGCGGQLLSFTPGEISGYSPTVNRSGADAMALLVRDGNLLTYANKVKLYEDGAMTREFEWGLIYTLANIDGNLWFYPGGNVSNEDKGLIADILLMSQTFNPGGTAQGFQFDKGSHFLLADTESDMAVGFMASNLLMAWNDTRIWVKPQGGADYMSGGIDILSPLSRTQFTGTFGGLRLPDTGVSLAPDSSDIVKGTILDVNLEGLLNLRLSPSSPDYADRNAEGYLNFSAALRLSNTNVSGFSGNDGTGAGTDLGTYISLAEPSRPDVQIIFGDINGDIAMVNGIIDLRSSNEDGDGTPKLVVANDIQFGETATARMNDAVTGLPGGLPGGAAGQPFRIDNVALGNGVTGTASTLGSIVLPSGQWHASITLKPQIP